MSELVKQMLDEDQLEDEEAQEMPLLNIKSTILAKVIEYCQYYLHNPMNEIEKVRFPLYLTCLFLLLHQPLKSVSMSEVVQEWYANYISVDRETLFELTLAANYMDVKPLLDLCCATTASLIKGKTPEEIRRQFNIVNDFSPEQEALVREENKWKEEA
jgi:S-phase kinase-associated protein 1